MAHRGVVHPGHRLLSRRGLFALRHGMAHGRVIHTARLLIGRLRRRPMAHGGMVHLGHRLLGGSRLWRLWHRVAHRGVIHLRHRLLGRWRLFAPLHLAVVHPAHVAVVHAAHAAVSHVGHGEQGTLPLRRDGGRHALTRSKGGATHAPALQWLSDDAVGLVLHRPTVYVICFGNRNTKLVDFSRLHVEIARAACR